MTDATWGLYTMSDDENRKDLLDCLGRILELLKTKKWVHRHHRPKFISNQRSLIVRDRES